MKILKTLAGSYSSRLELVEIKGKKYVLKTAEAEDIVGEKNLCAVLESLHLPSLRIYQHLQLRDNQLLLEYVVGSPTLAKKMTVKACTTWGRYMRRLHNVRHPTAATLEDGKIRPLDWEEWIREQIQKGIRKNIEKATDLHTTQIESLLNELAGYVPKYFGYLHRDAHAGNVLIRNGELCLFDKGARLLYGDPLYDLALSITEFPNGLYFETDDSERKSDFAYRTAFINGYGYDFISEQPKIFRLYVLLRAFNRYPNKLEPHLRQIIEHILSTSSR